MLNVGTSLSGFQLRMLHQLNRANRALNVNALRLATAKRINSAADDPAQFAFVARRRNELASVTQSISNAEKANSLVTTADSALSQVVDHITTIRTKALEAAGGGLSQAELAINQDAIDDALESIESIASTTEFAGKTLLDGSQGPSISGLNSSQVSRLVVLDTDAELASQPVSVNVNVAGELATLTYEGQVGSEVEMDATFTLTGELGGVVISVIKDEQLSAVRDRINQQSHLTGVTTVVNGDDLIFSSSKYGSSALVDVAVQSGEFDMIGGNGNGTDNGVDAQATINGQAETAEGLTFRFRSSSLDFDMDLESSFGTGQVDMITITGQGLTFQVGTNPGDTVSLGLPNVKTANLGGSAGTLSELLSNAGKSLLDGEAATAVTVADEALSQVLTQQAKVGSFSGTILNSHINMLYSRAESLSDIISRVEDADMAQELALQARNQILADNATAALLNRTADFFAIPDMFDLLAR